MGRVKLVLSIAVVAAAGTMIGAAFAGATVLCTTNANCTTSHNGGGGQMYSTPDTISAPSVGEVKITTSAGDVTCPRAEMKYKLTNTGGIGLVVPQETTINIEHCTYKTPNAVFHNCAEIHFSLYKGNFTLGTAPNGTVTTEKFFFWVNCMGISCTLGKEDFVLPITGGAEATLTATQLNLERKEGGAACPEWAKLDATFKTTTPVYLYPG